MFEDLVAANDDYAQRFTLGDLAPKAARGLAVVTCIDSRIEPLQMLGLQPGDAKILRNAGGRVTDDVLRTLVLAVYLLGVHRVLVMPHTHCRMAESTEESIHALILERYGVDTRSIAFETISDPVRTLRHDLERVRAHPLLPQDLEVGGAIYDVASGRLEAVEL